MIRGQRMQAKILKGTKRQIQKLIRLSKEALKDGFYRVAIRLHAVALNMEGKHAPDIAHVLKVHRSKVSLWLQNYEQEGTDGLLEGHRSGKPARDSQKMSFRNFRILSKAVLLHTDSPRVSGQALWWPE